MAGSTSNGGRARADDRHTALIDDFRDSADPPVSQLAERAEDEVVRWMWQIGFLTTETQERHLRSFRFGLFHGLATPHVDLAHLVIGVKWFCWGSLADDQYDNYDWGEADERFLGVLREMRAILGGETRPDHANPGARRLRRVLATAHRGAVPGQPTADADILAWHNDVYGLEKDIADAQTCNTVRVVAESERCSLQRAVERVLERAKQRQRSFVELEQLPELAASLELRPEAAAAGRRLARDMRRLRVALGEVPSGVG